MTSEEIEKRINNSEDKLCFICEKKPARFKIKGRPQDCYCKTCAIDNFGNVDYLEKMI